MNRNGLKREENGNKMIVGVVCKDGNVCEKYADASEVILYEIDRAHEIAEEKMIPVEGDGHFPVAGILIKNQANAVICGSIGMNAYSMMRSLKAHVFTGVKGEPKAALEALLKRELKELRSEETADLEHEEGCSGDCSSCAYH